MLAISHEKNIRGGNGREVSRRGPADSLDDNVDLVDARGAGKQRLAAQQLAQDAAHTPHVRAQRVAAAGGRVRTVRE